MARGRLLKTKVKEAKKIAEATEVGKSKGIMKALADRSFMDTVKMHIEKMWDRLEPLETAAVLGGTLIVKAVIEKAPGMLANVQNFVLDVSGWTFILGQFGVKMPRSEELEKDLADWRAQVVLYVISFVIAFCIIRWGDKLLEAGISGIQGIIGLLGVV